MNPFFIFGLPNFWGGFGFDGIALSTIISNYYVMFYMLLSVFNSKVVPLILNWTFDKAMFRELLRQMLPPTMSFQMIIVGVLIMQFALKSFGAEAIAGYSIAVRSEQLVLLPIL